MQLTGRQKRFLRSKGHHLDPAVMVGKDGVSDAVVEAVDAALAAEELIKVRVLDTCGEDRKEVAADLAERTASSLAQVLGRTLLLYRRDPEEPRLVLPGHDPA